MKETVVQSPQVRDAVLLYSVWSRMWTPSSLLSCNFYKLRDDFDDHGQLDSIAPKAPSTVPRGRNYLEFFKIFMNIWTDCSHSRCDWGYVVLTGFQMFANSDEHFPYFLFQVSTQKRSFEEYFNELSADDVKDETLVSTPKRVKSSQLL